MKNITTLFARNRKFYIVQNEEGFYLGIEDKYVDENGRLTKQLNGLQMKANKDLNWCIKGIKDHVEVEYLIEQGMDPMEAIETVCLA